MCLQVEKTGCLECIGDRECDGMLIGWCSGEEWTEINNLYNIRISRDR